MKQEGLVPRAECLVQEYGDEDDDHVDGDLAYSTVSIDRDCSITA